jgi:hypothetical protein
VVDGNVQTASASQTFNDTAFIIYTNRALYEFGPATPAFTFIDSNVAQVSAGDTNLVGTTFALSAYYLTTAGILVEWQPPTSSYPDGTYNFIDSNVAGMDGVEFAEDDVFIIYTTDQLFDHVGLTRAPSSFTYIDGNVGP